MIDALKQFDPGDQLKLSEVYELVGNKSCAQIDMKSFVKIYLKKRISREPGRDAQPWSEEQRKRTEALYYKAPFEFFSDVEAIHSVVCGFSNDAWPPEKLFKITELVPQMKYEIGQSLIHEMIKLLQPPPVGSQSERELRRARRREGINPQ